MTAVTTSENQPTTYSGAWRAVPKNVGLARRAVVAFLGGVGIGGRLVTDLELAVSECVSNVVYHAYVGKQLGEVRVRVDLHPHHVVLVVEDDGRGMGPRSDSPGSGMGLSLVEAMTQSLAFSTLPRGGTCVQARFARG